MLQRVQTQQVLIGRLSRGEDLLEGLTAICQAEGVRLGRVTALGAMEQARIGFYDQEQWEYRYLEITTPVELLALVGNVSLRDGHVVMHAHATFSDAAGHAFGGHLAPGTRVFACEFTIDILDGAELHRGYDAQTGLPLWQP